MVDIYQKALFNIADKESAWGRWHFQKREGQEETGHIL
jgi:hypothetical protein